MKTQKILAAALFVVSAALAVVSWLLLPQTVAAQMTLSGETGTTLPKIFAVLLPLALGAGGAAAAFFNKDESGSAGRRFLLPAVGIFMQLFTLYMNRGTF